MNVRGWGVGVGGGQACDLTHIRVQLYNRNTKRRPKEERYHIEQKDEKDQSGKNTESNTSFLFYFFFSFKHTLSWDQLMILFCFFAFDYFCSVSCWRMKPEYPLVCARSLLVIYLSSWNLYFLYKNMLINIRTQSNM